MWRAGTSPENQYSMDLLQMQAIHSWHHVNDDYNSSD